MKKKVKYKFGGLAKDDFLNAGASYVNYVGAVAGGALGNQDLIPEVGMSGDQATKDKWSKRSDIAENIGGMIGSTGAKIALSSVGVPPQMTALGQAGIGATTKGLTNEYNPDQSYKFGGNMIEFKGESHENGGIKIGESEVENLENMTNGVVHSKSYIYNKHLAKGLLMNNIDITKHIGKNPAQAIALEEKRYPRENDVYTNNSLEREKKTGVGKFAVENASAMIGDLVNPKTAIAKYGGRMKYELGGGMSEGGTYYTDPYQEIANMNSTYGNMMPTEGTSDQMYDSAIQSGFDNAFNNLPSNQPSATMNSDTYNNIGNLSNFIGPAYDVYRGLKGGRKVNYNTANPSLVDYSQSRNLAKNEIIKSYRENQKNYKDVNNPATYLALTANAAGQRDKAVSNMIRQSGENEVNANSAIKNQFEINNTQIKNAGIDATDKESDVASNTLSTGLYNMGAAGTQYGVDQKSFVNQETAKSMIGTGDYSYQYGPNGKPIGIKDKTGKVFFKIA